MESLPPDVLSILELGAYQILFLDRVPARAAVDESVRLARGLSGGVARWAPAVVNGTLRNLVRRRAELVPPDTSDPVERLAVEQSHPAWLVARWLERLGPERTNRLLARDNRVPAVHLRPNPLRTTAEALRASLRSRGIDAAPHPLEPEALVLAPGTPPEELPGWEDGVAWVQDVGSQWVVDAAGPLDAGARILDACAAPGVKLCGLVTRVARARALALDLDTGRLERVRENLRRLVRGGAWLAAGDARRPPTRTAYELVLADVPCSGTGVLGRRVDARWRRRPGDPARFARVQGEILDGLAGHVAPCGTLLYATCSLEREENEDVVAGFLERHPGFRLDPVGERVAPAARAGPFLATRPWDDDVDGLFAARLTRRSE